MDHGNTGCKIKILCVSALSRGHRAIQIPEILQRGGNREEAKRAKRKQRCVREINPALRHERNMFSYILLHFIEMYMSYLAACKPQIAQRESTRKTRE